MHNALTMLIFSRALRRAALAALIFPVISVSAHAQGNAADEIETARSECALLFRPVAAKMTAELRAVSRNSRPRAIPHTRVFSSCSFYAI